MLHSGQSYAPEDAEARTASGFAELGRQLGPERSTCSTGTAASSGRPEERAYVLSVSEAARAELSALEGEQKEALRSQKARKRLAYTERNRLVVVLASLYPSGTRRTNIAGWDPEWHGCVYIDTPEGQVSWHYHEDHRHFFAHLPPYRKPYDGHTTDQKYERLARLALSLSRHGSEGTPPPAAPGSDCALPHKRDALERLASHLIDETGEFSSVSLMGCYRCGLSEHGLHVALCTAARDEGVSDFKELASALRGVASSLEALLDKARQKAEAPP